MKSITSFIGWLLLAVILAVPAFLFYNWWMSKKNIEIQETSVLASSVDIPFDTDKEDNQPLAAGDVSNTSVQDLAPTEKMDSEINKAMDLQQPENISGDAPPVSSSANIQAEVNNNKIEVASPVEVEQSTGIAVSPVLNQPEVQGNNTQERKGSYFEPKTDRDPTLSPREYAQIKAELAAKKERERRFRLEELRKKNRSGIQNQLDLQGVVGNNVIINGEMYSVGSYVKGVKILKIGSNYFIGYYKGKKFKKVMR